MEVRDTVFARPPDATLEILIVAWPKQRFGAAPTACGGSATGMPKGHRLRWASRSAPRRRAQPQAFDFTTDRIPVVMNAADWRGACKDKPDQA
jgi:hypothetical protein